MTQICERMKNYQVGHSLQIKTSFFFTNWVRYYRVWQSLLVLASYLTRISFIWVSFQFLPNLIFPTCVCHFLLCFILIHSNICTLWTSAEFFVLFHCLPKKVSCYLPKFLDGICISRCQNKNSLHCRLKLRA